MIKCVICGNEFQRSGSRGPIPKFCSQKCKTLSKRTDHRRMWERLYRRARRAIGLDKYNVSRRAYYRERWRRLYRAPQYDPIPALYTGHRWFDMARQAVNGGRDVIPEYRDYSYNDEVGEALLALLEGRDMHEAIKEYRRQEYIPRYRTVHFGDWAEDEHPIEERFRELSVPSAEEEAVVQETLSARLNVKWHRNPKRSMHGGQRKSQPSNRRSNHR